ncbi:MULTISPECIES: hypothetical protein [unclassified Pseudomonas]|uniref:hypothetical protein n=1 Tax=unclassified Pseudomonas TaxID=196821 RepID=UPI000A1E4514|nr:MULTISPECIES: hypothetical protein [unclassified Pseudomonas]
MDLEQAERVAHEQYINHIMACKGCYAPTKRYCFYGLRFLVDYLAHYLMGRDLHTRRVHLAQIEAADPVTCDDLKARLIEIHEQMKGDEP